MNRINRSLSLMALVVAVHSTMATPAVAQMLDPIVRHYRFVAPRSVLDSIHVGLEAPDVEYRVHGTFDMMFYGNFQAGLSARFLHVAAYADLPPTAMAPIALNDVLNLEGLEGHQLPVASPFDVYQFTGQTKSGSSVSLFTDVLGPWLNIHGQTTLPEGQKSGVEYALRSLARQRPFADFTDDGMVDRHDLSVFSNHFGDHPSMDDAIDLGDADEDHNIEGADFLMWQSELGEQPPAAFASALAATSGAVPEPGSLALVLAGASLFMWRGRRVPLASRQWELPVDVELK